MNYTLKLFVLALGCLIFSGQLFAADIAVLTPETWEEFAPAGKEVDCVYGDTVVRTKDWVAVIARPVVTRNANMTVKAVGACVIDFTPRADSNDQMGAFYPGGLSHTFTTPDKVRITVDGQPLANSETIRATGSKIVWECGDDDAPPQIETPGTDPSKQPVEPPKEDPAKIKPRMLRRYTIEEGKPYLLVETVYTNSAEGEATEKLLDTLRADKVFTLGHDEEGKLVWAQDDWFRQTYGFLADGFKYVPLTKGANFSFASDNAELKLAAGQSRKFTRKLFCGESLAAVRSAIAELNGVATFPVNIEVKHPLGPAVQAKLTIQSAEEISSSARTDATGKWQGKLPGGDYELLVEYLGHPEVRQKFTVGASASVAISLPQIGAVKFNVTDEQNRPIPCKVSFFGQNKLAHPDFGPDSGEVGVKNAYYSHNGTFVQPLMAGSYEALVSYGPEYDVVTLTFDVAAGQQKNVEAQLKHVVDSKGWISSDFHNHASPSGDNVSSQRGRVLNLVCENIEFAPCTEHNRIDSYVPHLKALGIIDRLATCTGIELTGSPLPINHQNAFPLIHKPRTQDGGGPTPAKNPVVQIEKLSMWDGGSEKLVQMNHPNLPQILGDRDLDGQMDAGFEKMFRFTDVIEIHPIQAIFERPEKDVDYRKKLNPAFAWLQMINLGYRIPGVVNTDAHYNFHGSGWMRNYIRSSTDKPSEISTPEMIRQTEAGHLFMTTGPFLQVEFKSAGDKLAVPGDDLAVADGKGELFVRVQCANWLDINRVQVFLNGREEKSLNFLRREKDSHFADGVVKFEARLPLEFKTDTHIVVGCLGENLTLGRLYGPEYGKEPPVALTNPVFVDVDGNGFQANGDLLDVPLQFDREQLPKKK